MMDTIGTITNMRNEGNLPNAVDELTLTPHLITAYAKVKALLGSVLYETIYSEGHPATPLVETERYIICSKAESLIALSYAVHSMNIATAGSGIVRAKGWDKERQDLMSREEIKDLSDHFYDLGFSLLQPYIPMVTTEENPLDISIGGLYMTAV